MATVWKIAPGEHAENWPLFHEHGCIGIGWLEEQDYQQFRKQSDVLNALEKAHTKNAPGHGAGAAKMVWQFVREIKGHDVVVANKGFNQVVGIGLVESEYLPPNDAKNPIRNADTHRRHVRRVTWLIDKPVDFDVKQFFLQQTLYPLKAEKVEQIRAAYLHDYPRDAKIKKHLDHLLNNVLPDSTAGGLLSAEEQLADEDAFDPNGIKDARQRVLSSIVRRQGQPDFRSRLLVAYKGKCAITGCAVQSVLEAAHIVPYQGEETNHIGNGLLLRGDFHTLFDLGLVAVDAKMRLLVSPTLAGTEYAEYQGEQITLPDHAADKPSPKALAQHRKESGLS